MNQNDKANHFKSLHMKGAPLVLYNVWDAGGAKVLAKAGSKAIATGSWSVAAAHGYKDGESIPLEFSLEIVKRIADTVDLPLTVDFEGAYAIAPDDVAANVGKVIQAGAVGINFEDQVVGGEGLHSIADQVERIKAARQAADQEGVSLFINARTDLFLKLGQEAHEDAVSEALQREAAYRSAGADGFFVPGLGQPALIEKIVKGANLPVNVMMRGDLTALGDVAEVGVSRASYGPGPYFDAMEDFAKRFNELN